MSVRVENVSKLYGEQLALDNVSFAVHSGEVVGFLGPNGAGKSTMMKIITGYLQPNSGQVWVNDLLVEGNTLEIRKQIGYLPEHNPLYLDLYVKEYMRFVGGIYRLPNVDQRVNEMIEMTGLGREAHKKIGALSKGYRQRVGLAQALIHDPKVLILDEPTSGLDPAQLVEIRQLIRNISTDKTVMLSTHIMQEVEAVCDRIVVINRGKIVEEDNLDFNLKSKSTTKKVVVEFMENVPPELLSSISGVTNVQPLKDGKWLIMGESDNLRQEIYRFAVAQNLTLVTLMNQEINIEKIFLEMVKKS